MHVGPVFFGGKNALVFFRRGGAVGVGFSLGPKLQRTHVAEKPAESTREVMDAAQVIDDACFAVITTRKSSPVVRGNFLPRIG